MNALISEFTVYHHELHGCSVDWHFIMNTAYAGAMTRLELNMKYDDFLIVKGLMLTARWRTTIISLFYCFVLLIINWGFLPHVHLLYILSLCTCYNISIATSLTRRVLHCMCECMKIGYMYLWYFLHCTCMCYLVVIIINERN